MLFKSECWQEHDLTRKSSQFHFQVAHVRQKAQPLLSLQLRVYDEPDRKTVGCGNSFPKQEVRPGGNTTKLMHVVVTKSMSVFNQRALVSHNKEGRALHSVINGRSPHQNAAPCLTSCSPLFQTVLKWKMLPRWPTFLALVFKFHGFERNACL